ncbi:ferric-chelate reductase [Spatholobus suberectus]|nr:ferric-chelate reductase [Spatholobus suberectus]
MASIRNLFLLFLTSFTTTVVPATSQPYNTYTFPNNVDYAACEGLPVLESTLHWNYRPSSGAVDVAFNKANAKGSSWVAWAINPTSNGMVGSEAFVAIHKSDGSIKAYTSPITSCETMLQEGNLTFPIYSVSATYTNGHVIIFASFQLPFNRTLVNHAWQEGLVSDDGTLRPHSFSRPNLQSFGTLDFVSGKVHGILNTDVLKGFDILDAHNIWKKTYVGIIISLAIIAVILEVITWIWVCNKKMVKKSEEHVDIGQQRAQLGRYTNLSSNINEVVGNAALPNQLHCMHQLQSKRLRKEEILKEANLDRKGI